MLSGTPPVAGCCSVRHGLFSPSSFRGLFYDQQVRSIRCTCFSQHLEGGQLKGRPGDDIEDMPNMLSYLRKTILVEEKKKIDQGNQQ
ncbi:hypothetical protein CEXT_486872 [Caerostris extrusa]|uniref:Uncharacterized protein n=1 Tax=Caerostris extrusa TaxID=172846 RepID=A0AAV4W966_CAEEX|nr:hypothetical protein CEXT_486872 [Caerostris extrusa]